MLSGANFVKFCSKWVTAQWSWDCKLQSVRCAWKRDKRHCRKCAFTNVAYVDPNMESIFEFNNLRFSPDMFCHISVIKDDCCVVVYGCFFLFWTSSSEWGGGGGKSSTLFTADAETILVETNAFLRWHFPNLVFSLNKSVHSDAQFYRTGCWWLFEFNSAKVHACKCSLNT